MEVEKIFTELGVNTTQVITMLYKKVKRDHELPVDLYLPNKETARAIKEARQGKGVVECENTDDLVKKLNL